MQKKEKNYSKARKDFQGEKIEKLNSEAPGRYTFEVKDWPHGRGYALLVNREEVREAI